MKLIIHIGNHKTGSTAIQTALSSNEDILTSYGILYPNTGRVKNAHHLWALNMRKETVTGFEEVEDVDELVVELLNEINFVKPDVVFLSSEEFFPAKMSDYERLSELFHHFESIEVVCVLRNQIEHLESGYKFSVLWEPISATQSFTEYLDIQLSSNYHDYSQALSKYLNCKTFNKVTALNFSNLIEDRKLVSNFLESLDLGGISLPEVDNNKSLSRLATIGLVLYNNGFMKGISREQFVEALTTELPSNKESFYTKDTYLQVNDMFETSNEKLLNIFNIDLNLSIPEDSELNFSGPNIRPRDIAFLFKSLIDKDK